MITPFSVHLFYICLIWCFSARDADATHIYSHATNNCMHLYFKIYYVNQSPKIGKPIKNLKDKTHENKNQPEEFKIKKRQIKLILK